ncbi:hypothetical protein DRW41_04940 [Neobacillus piezotolerans]|uniref:HEAT repeat domain-containing protein n=1 Tax=Neobacillus piezotolerans TaxID=2259171 RepID=A0A3D8GWT6_9BACI|nr:hypothetical protein [Neobacillus piezotolerans]RDU38903.1 hypothetical protein DRW41_04940 [Neobacillus piezotolerans]
MGRKIKVIGLLIAALSLVISAGVAAAKSNTLQKYLAMNEESVESELQSLDTEQLIEEIDAIASTEETDDKLMPFVAALFEKKNKVQDSQLVKIIKDKNKADKTREAMVDLYLHKHEKEPITEEMKELLKSPDVNERVKTKIVAGANFSGKDVPLLKELIAKDDALVAFHSLKQLSKTNAKEAYTISSEILSNLNVAPKDKVSAALKSTAKYLKKQSPTPNNDSKAEEDFLNISFNLIETSNDGYLKDSAFFAVSDLQSEKAMKKIIESNSVDRELKVFAIDQNFATLKKMLQTNPTESDIKVAVEAMKLYPIVDLAEALENAMKTVKNPQLKQEAKDAINLMKEQGVKGNEKWLDKN